MHFNNEKSSIKAKSKTLYDVSDTVKFKKNVSVIPVRHACSAVTRVVIMQFLKTFKFVRELKI